MTSPAVLRTEAAPPAVWTRLVERQIPDTMAARGLTREQAINDVLLEAQPTKQFVTVEEIAALALYLNPTPPARSPAPSSASMAAGPRLRSPPPNFRHSWVAGTDARP